MKKMIIFIILLTVPFFNVVCKTPPAKKKGVVGRVKDAAAYGFGWQLGKEGAKEAIQKSKEVVNSPKTKENIKKAKTKIKEQVDKIKK